MKNNSNRKTFKIRLDKIFKNNVNYTIFKKKIEVINKILDVGSIFLRSFLLFIIEYNNDPKNIIKITKPIIDLKFLKMVIGVINTGTTAVKKGPPPLDSQNLLPIIKKYYSNFVYETKILPFNCSNISYILDDEYNKILISIRNNITYHLDKHIWKYIRANFIDEYNLIVNNKKDDLVYDDPLEKQNLTEYYKKLEVIKNDLYKRDLNSPSKYHLWIIKNRKLILPKSHTITMDIDSDSSDFSTNVENNTYDYLKCMHYMSNYVQKKEIKSYQIIPIRTNLYSNYIKINTKALIDLFYFDNNKGKLLTMTGKIKIQKRFWNKYFKLRTSRHKYKRKEFYRDRYIFKGYSFNYEIETDGYAVSLNLIKNTDICNKEKRKENLTKGRAKTNKIIKEEGIEEYDKYKKDKKEKADKKIKEDEKKQKAKKKELNEKYKQSSKEEKEKIKNDINENNEHPHIDNLIHNEKKRLELLNLYKSGKLVVCDPGSKSILYMMACNNEIHVKEKKLKNNSFGVSVWNDHKIMNYTSKTRVKALKRLEQGKIIESWKLNTDTSIFKYHLDIEKEYLKYIKDKEIRESIKKEIKWKQKSLKDIETELCMYNSKSCDHKEFLKYALKRFECLKKLNEQYDKEKINKLRWYTYVNKRRHEDELLNQIENEFGKDIVLIIGDYSGKGQIKRISTPNIGIKRKLSERFKVYLINEHLTSKIHYKNYETGLRCDNLRIKMKVLEKEKYNKETKKKEKATIVEKKVKLHSVLSYKIEKEVMGCKVLEQGCLNRDKNSVLNMETIVNYYLIHKKRHPTFTHTRNQLDPYGQAN